MPRACNAQAVADGSLDSIPPGNDSTAVSKLPVLVPPFHMGRLVGWLIQAVMPILARWAAYLAPG